MPTVAHAATPLMDSARARPRVGCGLTTRQARTHDHIVRCPSCGSWMIAADEEAEVLGGSGVTVPAVCCHVGTESADSQGGV